MAHTSSNPYYLYYKSQIGGSLPFPVFRGAQSGAGIGNIFRSIGRFLMPIVKPVAATFLSSAVKSLGEGRGFKEAAKSAVAPTIKAAGKHTSRAITQRQGNGDVYKAPKRKHTAKPLKTTKKSKIARFSPTNF